MEKYTAFSRPDNVSSEKLAKIRRQAQERDLFGLTTMDIYLTDSLYMKEWTCNQCGTVNIPCAQGECPSCNNPRPEAWRDPEQGEGNKLGAHRIRARQQ